MGLFNFQKYNSVQGSADPDLFSACLNHFEKLFTVPLSQNGFDNGGISGVCKWAQNPDEVEFALSVLERLAKRYGNRKGLFGIQPLNEPITENMWETMDIQNRYAPADQEMAKGSAPITTYLSFGI